MARSDSGLGNTYRVPGIAFLPCPCARLAGFLPEVKEPCSGLAAVGQGAKAPKPSGFRVYVTLGTETTAVVPPEAMLQGRGGLRVRTSSFGEPRQRGPGLGRSGREAMGALQDAVTTTSFAGRSGQDLPLPKDAVERSHVLETIDDIATVESPVVFIEGESGCGATTLLAQFCQHKAGYCFYLFIKPSSRHSYALEYLRITLAEQIASRLGKELPSAEIIDEPTYESLLFAARRLGKQSPIYFVIDGLQQIPPKEDAQVEQIFKSVLPIGWNEFRFLITGSPTRFQSMLGSVKAKPYRVQKLSKPESAQMLGGLNLPDDKIEALLQLCKGLPGRLASIRSLVSSEHEVDELLNARLADYPDFISLELKSINKLTEVQRLVVALIVYSKYPLSIETLIEQSKASREDLETIQASCSYIDISEDGCAFASETYRRYAEKIVSADRSKALTIQIDHLARNPGSGEAIQFLPAYYQTANQQQAIVDLLDNDHYTGLLDNTKSVAALRARAAMGARSAAELKKAAKIFQFSLQRSIFSSVASSRGFKEQVGALVALGRSDDALNIATQAPTVELRARMLAEYARHRIEIGAGTPGDDLIKIIRDYVRALDLAEISENVDDLAEDVAFFDIDLAIELLDRANGKKENRERDGAFLNLAFATAARPDLQSNVAARTESKISDEKNRSLIAFIASYFGGLTRTDVEKIAKDMPFERRVYFLRSVLSGPELGPGASDLMHYALEQIVAHSTYLPKVRDLADFATPLVYLKDVASATTLIGKFEAQLGLVEKRSPSVPLIDLKTKLAVGEASYNFESAHDRLLDAYWATATIESEEVRVDCIALVLRALRRIDKNGLIESKDKLGEVLQAELIEAIDRLLEKTASHFEVVRSTLTTLALEDIDSALNIAGRLNTHFCRDDAYELIASTALVTEPSERTRKALIDSIGLVSERWRRDGVILAAIKSCLRGAFKDKWLDELIGVVGSMSGPERKAEAIVLLLEMHAASDLPVPPALVDNFNSVEHLVPDLVFRTELLYRAVAAIAKSDQATADPIYKRAEAVRQGMRIGSESGVLTARCCLSLLLRAAKPLFEHDVFEESYLERFALLCRSVSDPILQIAYLSELASKAASLGRLEIAGQILSKHCTPLLDSVECAELQLEMRRLLFAPSYRVRGGIALRNLEGLGEYVRDHAIYALCLSLISGTTDGDERPTSFDNFTITYEVAESVVDLVKHISNDGLMAGVVRALVSCLCGRPTRHKITSQQRASIKEELLATARAKLPQAGSVSHEGYLVEIEAYLGKLTDADGMYWTSLIKRAERIPNLADQALVAVEIARMMPAKFSPMAKTLLSDYRQSIAKIPSPYDRLNRLENLIEAAKDVDLLLAKSCLKECMRVTFEITDVSDANKSRQKLLDLAEQLDPKGLDDLVSSIDDDPARSAAKREMQRHVRVQKVRRRIASAKDDKDGKDTSEDVLPNAARRNLASLLSGRSEAVVPDLLNKYIVASGEWGLSKSFPVFAWYLENLARRVMRQDDVVAKCVPLWEILLLSSELAVNVIERCEARATQTIFPSGEIAGEKSGILVPRGDAAAAYSYLRAWLRELGNTGIDQIVLSDPYFSLAEIDFIRLVAGELPSAKLIIVTSRKALEGITQDEFEASWSAAVDYDPPELELIGISDFGTAKSPIHDRWIMAGDGCLRLGSSVNGLGSRWTEISRVDPAMKAELCELLTQYIARRREVAGKRVSYATLSF